MKKIYTSPALNKIMFTAGDIITFSGMGNQADDIGEISLLSSFSLELPQ